MPKPPKVARLSHKRKAYLIAKEGLEMASLYARDVDLTKNMTGVGKKLGHDLKVVKPVSQSVKPQAYQKAGQFQPI
jgi:hypothetical protein